MELAGRADELAARGVAVVAIAADPVDELRKVAAEHPGLAHYSDPELRTTAAWGLRLGDADSPYPGTFVVDGEGAVRWRRLGGPAGDWPTYAELDAQLPR